jgi:TPR repeat protein
VAAPKKESAKAELTRLLAGRVTTKNADRAYTLAAQLFEEITFAARPTEASFRLMARGFEAAAARGHAAAWLDLGRCRWNGWGVPEDREAALEAYTRSAELGSVEGAYAAAYNLYWVFEEYPAAYQYARLALAGGDPTGGVHYLLGLMAFHGRGCPESLVESVAHHKAAAARDNLDAMFELYVLYSTGAGVRKNERRAREWLWKAAEGGHPRATYNLGAFYATGNGVEKDTRAAVKWYGRSSSAGNARASATLGAMYLLGDGVKKDARRSREHLARARAQGMDTDAFLDAIGAR